MSSRPGNRRRAAVVAVAFAMGSGCSVVGNVVRRPVRGVDLNTAAVEELMTLPGISEADAARIIESRPYQVEEDLVARGIVSPEQLERLEVRAYVGYARSAVETRSCAPVVSPPEPPEETPDDESPDDDEEE